MDLVLIPAHTRSKRLPDKPLLRVNDKPLIWYTVQQAKELTPHVFVACDDERVARTCEEFGIDFVMTDAHPTGTHRCAEALCYLHKSDAKLLQVDRVINWQVDEPLLDPSWVGKLLVYGRATTLAAAFNTAEERLLANNTKVACSKVNGRYLGDEFAQRARWFSRAPMWGSYHHIGVYAYPPHILMRFGDLLPTELSKTEQLEQLAWLENDYEIDVILMPNAPLSVNSRDDFDAFRQAVSRR